MNLGRKTESPTAVEAPKEDKNKVSYPSLMLYDIPDLPFDDKDAGKEFNITGRVKINSVTKRADGKKSSVEASLDFMEINFEKRKGKADLAKSLQDEE